VATFSIKDTQNMALALKLASKGRYGVKANPMVGCVIVKDDKIIAKGYHETFGEAHAEINALKQINHQADIKAKLLLVHKPLLMLAPKK